MDIETKCIRFKLLTANDAHSTIKDQGVSGVQGLDNSDVFIKIVVAW
jgi:hypothetical protein